jgi:hypothetical protein
MRWCRLGLAAALGAWLTVPLHAQQPSIAIDDDDITISGCITRVTPASGIPDLLVWSRSDIMLAGAVAVGARVPIGTTGIGGRSFFWLNEDLSDYVGQRLEIEGELEGIEKGEIEIDRHGDVTDIELDLKGREEKARVPTAWLGVGALDAEFDIVAHKVDVENVRVVGSCEP